MKKFLRITLRIVLGLVAFILLLIVGIYFFIQTETFNKWALDFGVQKLNEAWNLKDSRLEVQSLKGNILKGLTINKGAIIVSNDTLINFSYVNLKYDIWGLLKKNINLDYVIINSPVINLYKVKDADSLVWNYEKLFTSQKEVIDTSQAKFDWGIIVNNLKIENASFNSSDKLPSPGWKNNIASLDSFNFNNTKLYNLEVQLNAKYFSDYKFVELYNLACNSNSDFKIQKLSFTSEINEKDTISTISNLNLVTNYSHVVFNKLQLHSFSPFDSLAFENFENKKFIADINIDKFNFRDLRYFVPSFNILDSAAALKLKADGSYGDINIENLTVNFPESEVNVKGQAKNLNNPDSLYFDIAAKNIFILPSDVAKVYPSAIVKSYEQLGRLNGDIIYKGTLKNFYSKFDVRTENSGAALGEVTIDLDKENYHGIVQTSSLNLGKILNSKSLSSRINSTVNFVGTGFSLNKMYANVKYSVSNSSFNNYDIRYSTGVINTQGNSIKLNIRHYSSMGNAVAVGRVNIANLKNPVYAVKGNVTGLNIAAFTRSSEDKSNLNFSFDVNGRGAGLENINGKFNLDIQNSSYAQYTIPKTPLNINIANSGNTGIVNVTTDFMKFDIKGSTNFAAISKTIAYNISTASNSFTSRLKKDSVSYAYATAPSDNFTLDYSLVITDSAKANIIFNPFGVKFLGSINGNITNNNQSFTSLTNLDAKNFTYNDTAIFLRNYTAKLNFENDYTQSSNSLNPLSVQADIRGEKGIVQNNIVDSLVMKFNLAQSQGNINLTAKQDSTKNLLLKGNLDLASDDLKVKIDSLNANYDKYKVNNANQWVITYTPDEKVTISQMGLQSRNAVVNVKGDYVFNGESDITLDSKNLNLADVFDVIYAMDTSKVIEQKPNPMGGSFREFYVNFKGDTKNPIITASIISDSLKYEDTPFGKLNTALKYENEKADVKVNFQNSTDNKGSLDITGNIPYANPLGDSTKASDFSSTPMQFKLNAKDFQISYLMKFIPSLNNAEGILNGEINADGLVSSPNLTGNMKIDAGNVFLTTTGMNYKYVAMFNTANSKLVVERISISDTEDDSKHMDINGSIDFTGMKINDIDLSARGDFVILNKGVDKNDLGVKGYLWGGSGNPPISIKGNLDKLNVTGQFLIKEASITSIPMGGSGYDTENDNFIYINEVDSNKGTKTMADLETYKRLNAFERINYFLKDSASYTAAKKFLNLDMNVRTEKNIYVSIDFNNLTRDRLFGEIQADMTMKTEGNQIIARGKVDAVGNSYYRLYKNFKIGNSSVTFDGPITDPEIHLEAIHTGTKTTEQYGTTTSSEVQVKAIISGRVSKPVVELKLLENGAEVGGTDAQSDAITYLLFGKFRNELSTTQRQSVATSVGTTLGSNYAASILSQTVRDILPFLIDAEFNYTEGKVADTDVQLTSEFGDATVKVGGQFFKEVKNFEFVVDYPVNKMLNLNLPETLLLEFFKQDLVNSVSGLNNQTSTNTGVKVIYKIKF
jgi:hypothetical protein